MARNSSQNDMAEPFTFEEAIEPFTFEEAAPKPFSFEEATEAQTATVAQMAAATRHTLGVVGRAIAATDVALENRPEQEVEVAQPTDQWGRPPDPRGRNPAQLNPAWEGTRLSSVTGSEMLMRPLVEIPGIDFGILGPSQANVSTGTKVAAGAYNAAKTVPEFFTSLLGVSTLTAGGLPALVQRLVAGGFAVDLASHTPEQVVALAKAVESGDAQEISHTATSLGINVALAGLTAKHALRSSAPGAVVARALSEQVKATELADPNLAALKQVAPLTAEAVAKTTPIEAKPAEPFIAPVELKGSDTPLTTAAVESVKEPAPSAPAPTPAVATSGSGTPPVPAGVPPAKPVLAQEPPVAKPEGERALTSEPVAKVQAEVSKVASEEGQRSAKDIKNELVSEIQKAIDAAPLTRDVEAKFATKVSGERYETQPDSRTKVTIEIPGDGTFTVWNTKEALGELLVRAKKIATKPTPEPTIRRQGTSVEDKAEVERLIKAGSGTTGLAGEKGGELPKSETEQSSTTRSSDPFDEAQRGDESAFDHLDEQFRKIYPEPEELGRPGGRPSPHQVHTPEAFVRMFNTAFSARDFDSVLQAIKATSDVNIWKPMLKDLFKKQATDPIAAKKAEWFRHVFAGTVPPDAIPKAPRPTATPPPPRPGTPPPGPTPPRGGTPPPPRPPPQTPYTPLPRIPVAPITGGGAKSPYKIIEDFSVAISKAIRVLKLKRRQLGVYRPGDTMTAERFAGDLDTAAHELAGHWTDDVHGLGKPWIAPRTRSPYDSELAKFWIHGSVTPSSSLRYRRAEGIAEFIRAYVVNPVQAKLDAPQFAAYFERTLPPKALKAINEFGKDVRTWAGEDPIRQGELMAAPEPLTLTQRLWNGIRGRGFGFEISPIDRLREKFDDPYHFAVKAFKEAAELQGRKLLPQEDFELLARLLSGHDRLMSRQFKNGLEPLRPEQRVNAQGKMEIVPLIDPITKAPMTLEWLHGAFDTTNLKSFETSRKQTSALMVHERTLEKAKQLGRQSNISGFGAGLQSDVAAANAFMARLAQDPGLHMTLTEGARRYRLWASHNIDMLVDAGRLSKEAAKDIRDRNEFYVDMHRLSEDFDIANFSQRGGSIGTARDVIRRMKGSSLQVDDVYRNLLDQTDSIQKEAHRNVAMNAFVDGLRNVRELHGPNLKDFDQFGRKVSEGNRNTIRIFKDGKAEHWQFAPEIYESLKGLGELQTNAIWTVLTTPSRFTRYMITMGPSFMARNIVRDTNERSVNSITGGKPWDILQGYTQADLARFETFGGGQFGNYMRDRLTWNRELKRVAEEMAGDPKNILLSPLRLKRAWEELGAKSETLGRIAEFRRAFKEGKKQIAKDHPGLSAQQLDYNAALWAAGQARGLLDFAKAGTVMRHVNQAIPFSNAAMRGLGKSFTGIKDNPGRYAMRWGLYVLTPTIAVMLWNLRDEETWKEYLQLPAYRRDMFFNLKVGDHWLTIPKPHLLGVLAGGVERALLRAIDGDPKALEGFGTSFKNAALPVADFGEASGPLKTFLELEFNRDTFRDRDIVPMWERDLKLELRKNKEHATGAGKGIADTLNVTGLEIDPRQIDHVLRSLGGLGNIVADTTRKDASVGGVAAKSTGFVADVVGTNSRDVQWVFDWAKENGELNELRVQTMRDMRRAVFEAPNREAFVKASAKLRTYATELRESLEPK